jgi:predicted Zn-dependent peptidase
MKTKIVSLITIFFLSLSAYAQVDRSKMPASGPAPQINLGTPKTFTLKNGLQVLVVENHKLPRVTVSLSIDNPPMAYGNKKGVEGLLSGMLGTGSKNISKEDFDKEVDYLGANVSFSASGAFASSLTKYSKRVLELMSEAAFNPVFSKDEFDKQKKQSIEGIKSNEKSVTAIAGRVDRLLTYGKNHPYGEFTSAKTLENVSLQDVQELYNKTYKPNNAYLVIIGDVKFKDVKKQVKALFSSWAKGELPKSELPKVENVATTEINFINMPNAVQSEVAVINSVSLKMGDKDYYAALLANQILGGGGTGRLYKNLREDKGYTYGAYSGIGADRYTSRFKASASVRNMVTDSAVVEMMKEINKIRYGKINQAELDIAKSKYLGNFVRAIERPSTVANYALNILTQNLPKDYYENYLKNFNAVTLEDVQNAAIKYFRADKARIVITGKGIDVLKNLEKNSDYKINYFDKFGNPTEKPEMTLPIPAGVTAASVVDNYFKAIGGKEKIASVKTLMVTSEAAFNGAALTLVTKNAAPNKSFLMLTGFGQTLQKQVFDGEKGYNEAQGRKVDMTAKEIEEAKAKVGPFGDATNKNGKLDRIEPLDGKNAYVIVLKDGREVFYDVASGLRVKSVNVVKAPDGKEVRIPTSFSDYKAVNGILIPHKIDRSAGRATLNFVVKEVKMNEGVSDKDFE